MKTKNDGHPVDPPRKQVLLLSCMDLRLSDDTTHLMNEYNLENRYDHLILAGAAMGARLLKTAAPDGTMFPWKYLFFHHLEAAIDVLHRDIKDIIILEHLDCGAYKYLHPKASVRDKYEKLSKTNMSGLTPIHRREARAFAKEIGQFCAKKRLEATNEIEDIQQKIEQHTATIDDYRNLVKFEGAVESWSDINVRCFQLDLRGRIKKL